MRAGPTEARGTKALCLQPAHSWEIRTLQTDTTPHRESTLPPFLPHSLTLLSRTVALFHSPSLALFSTSLLPSLTCSFSLIQPLSLYFALILSPFIFHSVSLFFSLFFSPSPLNSLPLHHSLLCLTPFPISCSHFPLFHTQTYYSILNFYIPAWIRWLYLGRNGVIISLTVNDSRRQIFNWSSTGLIFFLSFPLSLSHTHTEPFN